MNKILLTAALAVAWASAIVTPKAEANWPQWRGPLATGEAPGSKPPTTWGEDRNIKWKVKLPGFANSTPVIWGDRIYVATAISETPASPASSTAVAKPAPASGADGVPWKKPEGWNVGPIGQGKATTEAKPAPSPSAAPAAAGDTPEVVERRRRGGGGGGGRGMRSEAPTAKTQFALVALDRATGKVVWQKTAREEVPHEGHHRDGSFASASPVTDGERIWVFFGSRGLYCYDLAGNLQWEKDLGDMQTRNAFGEGASPAVHGEMLVVNWDHEGEDFVVALDKRTGAEKWRQKRDEPTTWSTPLIVEHEGKPQVIVNATNRVRSYDLATGSLLWEASGMTTNVIPSPVFAAGTVYALSGFRGAALLAIKLGGSGLLDGTPSIAWKHNKSTPYVPSPLLAGDRLYFLSGNNALVSCFNAKTGAPHFEAHRLAELGGGVYASPVAANGHVYIVGRDGKTAVLKIADQPEVVAINTLNDRIDASPAIVGNEIYLRGNEHLYCIAEK